MTRADRLLYWWLLAALAGACAPRTPAPVQRVSMPELAAVESDAPPPVEPEPLAEEPESEPERAPAAEGNRATIQGTIEIGIQLLEQGRYAELIRELAHPDDVAELESDQELEQVAAELEGEKATLLFDILVALRTRTPKISEDGTEASFDVSDFPDAPDDTLTLKRVGDRWYIAN